MVPLPQINAQSSDEHYIKANEGRHTIAKRLSTSNMIFFFYEALTNVTIRAI